MIRKTKEILSLVPIGTQVLLGPIQEIEDGEGILGEVVAISIKGYKQPYILYQIEWWDEKNLKQEWFSEEQFKIHDKVVPPVKIGFSNVSSRNYDDNPTKHP